MSDDAREKLAREQAALARALGLGEPVPEGFDAERVRASADTLLAKRRRLVQRAWPALAEALGKDFAERFNTWARSHPLLDVEPHPLSDGRRFAEALRARGPLPDAVEAEVFGFELRWRVTPEGALLPRRGLVLKVARLGAARRRVLAIRLPWGRILRWRLPG
jgi:hypothetical protein